jgi:hypothetical protein
MSKFPQLVVAVMLAVPYLLSLSGCRTLAYATPVIGPGLIIKDQIDHEQKQKLSQKIMSQPDLPAWSEARERIVLAEGDRVFDNDVDSVYRAAITAVASLEVHVQNTERESGFISGSGKILPPDRASALRKARMIEFAKAHGMSPRSAEPGPYFDPTAMTAVMEAATGMTITVGPHGDGQTKIKARFSQIYYPRELSECYTVLWQAIDRQGFLDRALDSPA